MSQITFSSYREPTPSPKTISLPQSLNKKASVIALQAKKIPIVTEYRNQAPAHRACRMARENTAVNNPPKPNPNPPESKEINNTQYKVIQSDNGSAKLLLDESKFQNIQDQHSLVQDSKDIGIDDPVRVRQNCSFATAEENGKKVGFASISPVEEEGAISRMIKKIKYYGEGFCKCQTITVAANEPKELSHGELDSIRKLGFSVTSNKSAFVAQKPFLFLDTIRENITVGKKISDEALEQAARKAHAEEFICRLPQKYDTVLAEAGQNLSGGQQQRLAIARALARNAPVLILDEATSSLDAISENYIKQAIASLQGEVTQVIIAHRLSTIEHADKIIYLEKGRKIAEGTKAELLNSCDSFRAMWEMYHINLQVSDPQAEKIGV